MEISAASSCSLGDDGVYASAITRDTLRRGEGHINLNKNTQNI